MVVQVGSHRRYVADDVDPDVLQMLRGSQSRQQQKLRRTIGTTGYDDLAPCPGDAAALRDMVLDAGGTVVLDQHAYGVGAGAHH